MTIDTINKSLRERFAQPLPDCYVRRIIFWYDSEREFESILDELDIPDVKLLKLTGNNFFYAKMLLSETDTDSNYLVYQPVAFRSNTDNWLRDIERYSEEFRADLVSIQMDELHIPQTTQLRRAMKHYRKFFESKERAAKFLSLGTKYENAAQMHIDIMTILCETKTNTAHGIIRAILCDSLYEEENSALENIHKFGSEDALREMLAKFTGYAEEEISLYNLAVHILITALSASVDKSVLMGLEKYISESEQAFCYADLDDWIHSENAEKLFELSSEIENNFGILKRLEKLDIADLLKADCLPCIDECIISRYMNEISEDVIKSADIFDAVDARRTSRWHSKFSYFYDGLYYFAKMHEFYLNHISGFHYGEYRQMWQAYCDELYLMDTYYRKFHIAFGKSLKNAESRLDDLFKNVAESAERLYKNWYLTELNSQWFRLICDDMEQTGSLRLLPQQHNFYKDKALPIIRNNSRIFVIISDALRFETAAELTEKLIRETNGTAEISAIQSVFPSATKYGMAALLPHEKLQLSDDLKVLCDDESTEGTENRDKILKKYCSKNVAVTYKTLLSMKQNQRRELISGAQTVYIYHNTIDAVGDKAATEDQVFEACENTFEELKNLVNLIINSMSGSNIVITSDHGFLYSYNPLSESEKAEKALVDSCVLELERRSIITDKSAKSNVLMRIPLTVFSSDYAGFTPNENIRIKKQGGGMNFVHGGISLQECCVPVIAFKNIRAGSKNFVNTKKVEVKLLSTTRKISNNIFFLDFYQREAVGGKIIPATYEVFISDSLGNTVSDVQKLIADKTTDVVQDRVTRVRFMLKGQNFDGNASYYLNILDKDTGTVLEHIEFSIKIAFANDFDF